LLIVKWAFSHDRNSGIILPIDRNFRLIAEWRTEEGPMNKKAKTKAQKADEDANLDEALDESFPTSPSHQDMLRSTSPLFNRASGLIPNERALGRV
jgi:hypothetical protein